MVTSLTAPNASFPTSAQYFVRNGDTEGFIDPMACVTIAGYGYNGRVAQACKQVRLNHQHEAAAPVSVPVGWVPN